MTLTATSRPFSSVNSRIVPGRIPSCSRSTLGMVIWPRSATVALIAAPKYAIESMNPYLYAYTESIRTLQGIVKLMVRVVYLQPADKVLLQEWQVICYNEP